MSSKIVNAVYDDDDTLLHAVKDVKKAEYRIEEVFTPFPVHGLDHAMGLASTRLAITAFMYGILGFSIAITMINYIMIVDWPMNIGGKPSFSFMENLPADLLVCVNGMTNSLVKRIQSINRVMSCSLLPKNRNKIKEKLTF